MNSNTPLAVAVSATKDRLQASASDIWTSIRSLDELARKTTTQQGPETPKSEGTVSASLERIENVFRVMFGSCTTGVHAPAGGSESTQACGETQACNTSRREFISQKDLGAHVYAQLFMDDQQRATRAVDGLREQDHRQKVEQPSPKPPSRQSMHPFPSSSPARKGPSTHTGPNGTSRMRPIEIEFDLSFDDGISDVSGHTLAEMARVHECKANSSNQQGLFSRAVEVNDNIPHNLASGSKQSREESTKMQALSRIAPVVSPVKMARGRSSGTLASKGTRSSRCTRSSNSTQDSEFAHVWYKQEQKYWDHVVEKDKKDGNVGMTGPSKLHQKSRRRSRCGSFSVSRARLKRRRKCTIVSAILTVLFLIYCYRHIKTILSQQPALPLTRT